MELSSEEITMLRNMYCGDHDDFQLALSILNNAPDSFEERCRLFTKLVNDGVHQNTKEYWESRSMINDSIPWCAIEEEAKKLRNVNSK